MRVEHQEAMHRFDLLDDEDRQAGELEYRPGAGARLYAIHTEVFASYRGHGYAALLLDALVAYAREQGQKIVPVCTYVIHAFDKVPTRYADVME